jgi:hypothetical protein
MNNRQVVKYTPDALVFLNGDTSLPGCPRCRGRVEIQRYVTSLNIEAGVQPGGHSAGIQLSLPRMQGEQVFIDGYNILQPGLEVHIFLRGYFPVRGMFAHLPDPQNPPDTPSFPNATGTDQIDMSKYATYPYYPAFHGVVTSVSYDYSGGFYTGTLNCASLLHFWSFANVVTSGAWLSQNDKAINDAGRTLFGHNLNGMHPHAIIYTLYREVQAAGGVEFALKDYTNQSAVVERGGESLFHQATRYWEQRFKTRVQSLRMYGVNGNLFNAAQQAWIGSASTRDVQRLLTSPTKNDPDTRTKVKGIFGARYSAAKALGLQGAGADFVFSPLLQQDGDAVNFSVLNLWAFTQGVGEIGISSSQLYQSTYQTKMDIATQVTTITGFELYQDVDGDIVFKPPFFNLDTSTSRYYRIEDQDLINISFTEKEPVGTHIIVRGQHIEGWSDILSNTGATGLRGHYIDYKLVAKFGWRAAATVEVTTYSDPKVLFYIGVGRLDLLNVATYSANVTIPIRAEMRPGFPVYIPFCDCYYYVTQLSHQFAFGGQCTTTLVLNCRRAKWHAPGLLEAAAPGKSAIDLIRLDRPDLPPRPLEIYENGIPRIVGFPNVVMALDVTKFNPNFSVVGGGLEYYASLANGKTGADLLLSMIQRDIDSLEAFEAVRTVTDTVTGEERVVDPTEVTRYRLRYGKNLASVIEFGVTELVTAFTDYQGVTADLRKLERQAEKLTRRANKARSATKQTGIRGGPSGPLKQLGQVELKMIEQRRKVAQFTGETENGQLLSLIFDALQPEGNRPVRAKVDGIAGSDATYSWYEQLTHLKGQFMASSVPGYYRYYSCAHPVEQMQGQPVLQWSDGEREKGRRRGRGASRAPDTSPPLSNASGRLQRFREERQGLQARLDALNVTFVRAGELLSSRDNGSSLHANLSPQEVANTPLKKNVADNLAKISEMGQELVNRLSKRSEFDGFSLAESSSWRVGSRVEGSGRQSTHTLGVALDLSLVGGGKFNVPKGTKNEDLPGRLPEAWAAAKDEASTMFAEGLLNGFGFYEERLASKGNNNRPFLHIDVRPGAPQRWTEVQGIPSYMKDSKMVQQCTAANAKNPAAVPDVEACIAAQKSLRSDAIRRWKAQRDRSVAQGAPGRKRTKDNSVGHPVQQVPEETSPTAAQPSTEQEPPPEPKTPPSITTRPVQADVPRLVVQFKPTVSTPDAALRPPEAELGVGPCKRGIQLATGRRRGRGTPAAVTTDLIQAISFTKHEARKFAQVVGTSMTTGRLTFNNIVIARRIEEKFNEAAQDLDDPDQTLRETWEDLYDQMQEDIGSVDIPFFENGDLVKTDLLELPSFEDALTIAVATIPEGLVPVLEEQGLLDFIIEVDDEDRVPAADFSFRQLSQFNGFKPQGAQKDDGMSWQRAVGAAASFYGVKITTEIERFFLESHNSALEPSTGKVERLGQVNTAFAELGAKGVGAERSVDMVIESAFVEKTVKQGQIKKPIYSPVFPVSDDRGYEHYGAYRYGRGLSVEPGGTFEFLNSGTDPFRNVTAENAELFLRLLTLRKQGKIADSTTDLEGRQQAAAASEQAILEEQQAVFGEGGGQAALTEVQRKTNQQSIDDISAVGRVLQGDPGAGNDLLRNLLSTSGDDPNLITAETFDLADTQFGRNFANFAVNYGKTDVFKTTVANAAYRLSDITAHLVARAGDMCVCRGSFSDVVLAAYARRNFVAVDGIDQQEHPATAFQSEQIIKSAQQHFLQQRRYRGSVLEGAQPDAKAFENTGGEQPALGAGAIPGAGLVPEEEGAEQVVGPDLPPTTADPEELPVPEDEQVEFGEDEDVEGGDALPSPGADPELAQAMADIAGISVGEMTSIINSGDAAQLAALVDATGFSVPQIAQALGLG